MEGRDTGWTQGECGDEPRRDSEPKGLPRRLRELHCSPTPPLQRRDEGGVKAVGGEAIIAARVLPGSRGRPVCVGPEDPSLARAVSTGLPAQRPLGPETG